MTKNNQLKAMPAAIASGAVAPLNAGGVTSFNYDPVSLTLFFTGVGVFVGGLLALWVLYQAVTYDTQRRLFRERGIPMPVSNRDDRPSWWAEQYRKWTDAVPPAKENDVMLDHEYDGIRELDNSLPPWWLALFYVTIVAGIAYFGYYHVADYGMSSREAYAAEMEEAKQAVRAHLARQVNTVDENSVTMPKDPQELAIGGSLFITYCAACHGAAGEGGVGPNLTDAYWLHGGGLKDIFTTVKYGVPEKGMIAWQAQLRPVDIQRVSAYIVTLAGTEPPNAKEPQGDLYVPEITPPVTEEDDDTLGSL